METVRALTPHVRDRRATYDTSLRLLEAVKNDSVQRGAGVAAVKTSLMLGLGETAAQIRETFKGILVLAVRLTH